MQSTAVQCAHMALRNRHSHRSLSLSLKLETMQVYVSYLEIYNDAGYDLLDPAREIHGFEDLPRVTVFEDASSGVSLRNLSLHVAADEEAALNLVSCASAPGSLSAKAPSDD